MLKEARALHLLWIFMLISVYFCKMNFAKDILTTYQVRLYLYVKVAAVHLYGVQVRLVDF